jgi:hypothetical protein
VIPSLGFSIVTIMSDNNLLYYACNNLTKDCHLHGNKGIVPGKYTIFATNKKWVSLALIAGPQFFELGYRNNAPFIREKIPDAFHFLRTSAYLYFVEDHGFYRVSPLTHLKHSKTIPIIAIQYIEDVLKAIEEEFAMEGDLVLYGE